MLHQDWAVGAENGGGWTAHGARSGVEAAVPRRWVTLAAAAAVAGTRVGVAVPALVAACPGSRGIERSDVSGVAWREGVEKTKKEKGERERVSPAHSTRRTQVDVVLSTRPALTLKGAACALVCVCVSSAMSQSDTHTRTRARGTHKSRSGAAHARKRGSAMQLSMRAADDVTLWPTTIQ